MVDTPEDQVAQELAKLRKELKLQRKNQRTMLRSFVEGAGKKFIAGAFTMAKSVDKLAVDFYKVGVNISNATEKLGEQFRTSEIGFTMSMRQHSKNLAIGFKGVQRDIMNLTNMAQVTGQDAEGQRRALLKSMVVGGLSMDATNALARTMIKTSLDYGTATQLMADNLDNILSKHGPSIALSMASRQIQGAVVKLTGQFPGYQAAISTLVDVMISGETDALATRAIYDVQRLSQQLDMAQTEDEAYKILMNAVSVLGPTLLSHTDKFAGTATAWMSRQVMAENLGNKNIALISNLWRAIKRGEGKTKKPGMDRVGEFDYLLTFQATTEKLLDPLTELGTAAQETAMKLYSMSTWLGPAFLGGLGSLLGMLPTAAAAYFGARKMRGRGGVPGGAPGGVPGVPGSSTRGGKPPGKIPLVPGPMDRVKAPPPKVPGSKFKIPSFLKGLSRKIPWIGAGLMVWDAIDLAMEKVGPITSGKTVKPKLKGFRNIESMLNEAEERGGKVGEDAQRFRKGIHQVPTVNIGGIDPQAMSTLIEGVKREAERRSEEESRQKGIESTSRHSGMGVSGRGRGARIESGRGGGWK